MSSNNPEWEAIRRRTERRAARAAADRRALAPRNPPADAARPIDGTPRAAMPSPASSPAHIRQQENAAPFERHHPIPVRPQVRPRCEYGLLRKIASALSVVVTIIRLLLRPFVIYPSALLLAWLFVPAGLRLIATAITNRLTAALWDADQPLSLSLWPDNAADIRTDFTVKSVFPLRNDIEKGAKYMSDIIVRNHGEDTAVKMLLYTFHNSDCLERFSNDPVGRLGSSDSSSSSSSSTQWTQYWAGIKEATAAAGSKDSTFLAEVQEPLEEVVVSSRRLLLQMDSWPASTQKPTMLLARAAEWWYFLTCRLLLHCHGQGENVCLVCLTPAQRVVVRRINMLENIISSIQAAQASALRLFGRPQDYSRIETPLCKIVKLLHDTVSYGDWQLSQKQLQMQVDGSGSGGGSGGSSSSTKTARARRTGSGGDAQSQEIAKRPIEDIGGATLELRGYSVAGIGLCRQGQRAVTGFAIKKKEIEDFSRRIDRFKGNLKEFQDRIAAWGVAAPYDGSEEAVQLEEELRRVVDEFLRDVTVVYG